VVNRVFKIISILSALVRVRNKIKRPDVAPGGGTIENELTFYLKMEPDEKSIALHPDNY
jgi:hypothetical protein